MFGRSDDILIHMSEQLNELQLSLVGKMFLASVGAWLVGKATNMMLRGTPAEIQAVQNAMMSSKRFQDELSRPGATVQSVIDKLGLKNASVAQFEKTLNVRWPF